VIRALYDWTMRLAASKHALHGFFDSLRAELASSGVGVRD